MYKILVTGSSGFIAKPLILSLLKNKKVQFIYGVDLKRGGLKNPKFKEFIIDICNKKNLDVFFNENKITHIVHLAARTDLNGKRLIDYKANFLGLKNLCECILELNIENAIFASTQLVNAIGDKTSNILDHKPDTAYGYSKSIGEFIVSSMLNEKNWTIFRPTTIWGPGMSLHYKNFLSLLEKNKYFNIGRKKCFKNFGFIDNAVKQLEYLLLSKDKLFFQKTIYLCDRRPIEIKKWAIDLALELGANKPITFPYFFANMLAQVNEVSSKILFSKAKYLIPLTNRRLKNITTAYQFESEDLWNSCPPSVSYSEAISRTIVWYISEKNNV